MITATNSGLHPTALARAEYDHHAGSTPCLR